VAHTIGLRRADKNRWERRVPLTPAQLARLVQQGLSFQVERSPLRAFPDEEYAAVGAATVSSLQDSKVILGVKEIPEELLLPERVYLFFSHTIKGQRGNMPMLRRLMDLGCTLLDYERIVDAHQRRLVFFGRHAGLAGMQDSLWALGQRLASEGLATPFAQLLPTHAYVNLQGVKAAVAGVGRSLAAQGIPEALRPLVVGFTGNGNVSRGAQEVLAALEPRSVTPEQLLQGSLPGDPATTVYQVVFEEPHLVAPREPGQPFALSDYYQHPERYQAIFEQYLPHLTLLINGIYWAPRYPRLVTRAALRGLFAAGGSPRLRVIGDISCDVEGSIEVTDRCTTPDAPVFVWDPTTETGRMGVAGPGPVILAVDNLPCELPTDSSDTFGAALLPLVPALAQADYAVDFAALALPPELKRAVILHRGALTPDYAYLSEHLAAAGQLPG